MNEPTREELLAEGYRRGILPPDMKAAFEEAVRRGILPDPMKVMEAPKSMVPAHTTDIPEMDLQAAHTKMQATADTVSPYARAFSPIVRMGLEGGGAAGGTALGLAGGPVGGVVGGGLGYAAGKAGADIFDEFMGIKHEGSGLDKYLDPAGQLIERGSTTERLTRPVRDTAAGMGMGIAGEVAAQGVMATVNSGKGIINWIKAPGVISKSGAEKGAANYIKASTSQGDIYAKNADEAMEIENVINAGIKEGEPQFKFSLGERSFDPNQIKAQQAINLPQGKAANLKVESKQNNDIALRNYFQRNFQGEEGVDDFMAALQGRKAKIDQAGANAEARSQVAAVRTPANSAEQAGGKVLEAIDEAEAPVKRAMGELEKNIPDYPMKFENLRAKITEIIDDPKLPLSQRKVIENFRDNELPELVKKGETTFAAMGINRTINDNSQKAYKAGDEAVGRIFKILKEEGLKPDLEVVSDLARTGKIVDFGGKQLDVDRLAGELERNLKELAGMKASTKVDVEEIKKGIRDAGGQPKMKVVHEGEEQYAQRLSKDYKNLTGKDAPIKAGVSKESIDALEIRNEWIKEMLSKASPGTDVGAAMRAFNEYSSKEYFGKFGTPSMEAATARGSQATGTKLRIEQIPAQFKTPTGADDLIRAVGPERAAEAMRGNFGYDLLQYATDPTTGKIVSAKLNSWLSKNNQVLSKYGLENEFTTLKNAQAAVDNAATVASDFEKSIAGKLLGGKSGRPVDSDKVISQILSGNKTAADMTQAVALVKSDPAALKGLKNSFGQWVTDYAETTWKSLADAKATTSSAQFIRGMKKANEAARVLYADEPAKLEALQTMQRAYEISARSTRAPGGVGSDTTEKVINTMAKNAMNIAVGSSKTAQAAKSFWNFIGNKRQVKVDEVIAQAIYDPDMAYTLMQGARGRINPDDFETTIGAKIIKMSDYRKNVRQEVMTGTAAASQNNE
jgi:hypothetical protein